LEAFGNFYGTFDGDGYVIKGLRTNSNENYVGLFGQVAAGSFIKNIGLENVDIIGGMFTGGLVGGLVGLEYRRNHLLYDEQRCADAEQYTIQLTYRGD